MVETVKKSFSVSSDKFNHRSINIMGKNYKAPLAFFIWVLFISSIQVFAKKSPRPISETEIREKKQNCYSEIELGYWGKECKASMVAKENCALKCLSPSCYELIYESDPLEEGERDYVRSSEYKYCMIRLSLGESLDGIRGSFE